MGIGESRTSSGQVAMSGTNPSPDEPVSYVVRLRERARNDIAAAHARFTEVASEDIA
jgi:hypothetical protein